MPPQAFDIPVPFSVGRVTVHRREETAENIAVEEPIYDGVYDAGFRAGRRRAFEEMALARSAESRRVEEALRQLQCVYSEFIAVMEGHFPELLLSALGRVFRNHDFTQEEMAREVASLLAEVTQAHAITIEAASSDLEFLKKNASPAALSHQQSRLEWKENAALERGEYILQTDLGTVDGRHLSKLAQMRTAMEA